MWFKEAVYITHGQHSNQQRNIRLYHCDHFSLLINLSNDSNFLLIKGTEDVEFTCGELWKSELWESSGWTAQRYSTFTQQCGVSYVYVVYGFYTSSVMWMYDYALSLCTPKNEHYNIVQATESIITDQVMFLGHWKITSFFFVFCAAPHTSSKKACICFIC